MDKISVLLVDDHALVRRGFRRMLEDDAELPWWAKPATARKRWSAMELQPDVMVMDCALPEINGIEATRSIREAWPAARILMLSMHAEDTLVRQAMDAGASGYVLKNALDLDLVKAVRSVFEGKVGVGPADCGNAALKGERDGGLTPRELEILQHIVAGQSNKEIATELKSEREHRGGASREYYGCAGDPQGGGTGGVCDSTWTGNAAVKRREFRREVWIWAGIGAGLGVGWQLRLVSPHGRRQPVRAFVLRCHGRGGNSLSTQQWGVWREIAAGNAGIWVRISGLRRGRLAGHFAG